MEIKKCSAANITLDKKLDNKIIDLDIKVQQIRKALQDKTNKNHNDMLDKTSKAMNQVVNLQKNMELQMKSGEGHGRQINNNAEKLIIY